MMKTIKLCFVLLYILLSTQSLVYAEIDIKEQPIMGVSAATIGLAKEEISVEEQLRSGSQILSLDQFYKIGGENVPTMETESRFIYTNDSLFILFRCTDANMQYPTMQHDVNWYDSPPEVQDAAFSDKVDLFLRPDFSSASYYHFSVTKEGKGFAIKRELSSNGAKRKEKITNFKSNISFEKDAWIVLLHIPWQIIGGKPNNYFGFIPMRTYWRAGEISSPVAVDFTDRPSPDLYIEANLGKYPRIIKSSDMLTTLPSGVKRWVRPALLKYPSRRTIYDIYNLEQSINQQTTTENLSHRIELIQAWTDLMKLEGFNFGSTRGSIVREDMYPRDLRIRVNDALLKNDVKRACSLLDNYLKRLDRISSKWFADGSPGNILYQIWRPINKIKNVKIKSHNVIMQCMAEDYAVDFSMSFPKSGGVRLQANREGFFEPQDLSEIKMKKVKKKNGYQLMAGEQSVTIDLDSLSLIFNNDSDNLIMKIGLNNIAFLFDNNDSIYAVDFRNDLGQGESIYGFGERYDNLNQRGQILTLWGMDDWIGNTIGLHNETYKPIPLFHSSKGYTIFINSSYRLRADIGLNIQDQYRLTQHGSIFDFYIWTSPPLKAIQSYTEITGKPILPPKWAFGSWMGRTGRAWADNELSDPVYEEKRVTQKFEHLNIPHTAIYAERGADSPELYTFMRHRDIKVLSWFNSEISKNKQKELLPELHSDQLPILKFEDTLESSSHKISYVDFTNPHAIELSRRWWKNRLDLGVAGSMVDFGDRVPEDASFYNGKKGDEMHNFYAYFYHKTYSEVFKEKRGEDYILFARSAAPGDQKWVTHFSGDHAANFSGLRGELVGGLNFSASGFSNWGTQLGGHRGWPDPVVFMRWTQFACFSPLMRAHGMTPREPWEYGGNAVENYKYYAWVRENLLTYIYNEAIYAHNTGIPMMKSMMMAYPDEKRYERIDDQYLFGRDLLVAPMVSEDTFRTISFPNGKWFCLWSGKAINGGDSLTIKVPLNTIPVYLKEGAILSVDLDSTLQFGERISEGKVSATIITPPKETQFKKIRNDQKEEEEITLTSNEDGYSINLKNSLRTYYLITYDTEIKGVEVNGERLPVLKNDKRYTLPPGWFIDESNKRTVIRMPATRDKMIKIYNE